MPPPATQSMLDLLGWIAAAPRTYADVMDVWRSTCPRLAVWEDALGCGMVQLERGATLNTSAVTLTADGRAALANHLSGPAAGNGRDESPSNG
jgi:hypothetical protein